MKIYEIIVFKSSGLSCLGRGEGRVPLGTVVYVTFGLFFFSFQRNNRASIKDVLLLILFV